MSTVLPVSSSDIGPVGSVELETRFVGRRTTFQKLISDLREGTRLVTVTGPPGIGKTRIARETAARVEDDYDGGCWFLDLRDLDSASDLISVMAERLGIPLEAEEGTERTAHSLAGHASTLLILDNAEHLAGSEFSDLLRRWLQRAVNLQVLVTSRHRIDVEFEVCHALSPLETSDAVELFEERAKKVVPSFDVDEDNRQAVGELVERLDRLPLAVKLAAGRIRILSPGQMLDRLNQRFELLDGSSSSRQFRSLEQAIETSWESLSTAQKTTLAHCSVFRGGFTMEAAEAVVSLGDDAPPVFEIVSQLVDHSLLQSTRDRESSGRVELRMLESIRSYVTERMRERGDIEGLRGRHTDYFLDICRYSPGFVNKSEFLEWVDPVARHIDNLRHALDWCIPERPGDAALLASTLADFYTYRRNRRSAAELAERVLAECNLDSHRRMKAKLTYVRGVYLQRRGEHEPARAFFLQARELADDAGADELRCRLCFALGLNAYSLGRYERSSAIFEEGLAIADEQGFDLAKSVLLSFRGRMECELGQLDRAEATLERALALFDRIDAPSQEMRVRINFGTLLQYRRQPDRALDHIRRGIEVARQADTPIVPTTDNSNLACALTIVGDYDEAVEQFEIADKSLQRQGLLKAQVNSLFNFGLLLLDMGNGERAEGILQRALENNPPDNHVGGFTNRGGILAALAVLQARRGRNRAAQHQLEQARRQAQELGDDQIADKFDHYLRRVEEVVRLECPDARQGRPDASERDELRRELLPDDDSPFLSFENELANRLLAHTLEQFADSDDSGDTETEPEPADLCIGPDGRWVELPSGERLDFSRRGALRRLLIAFVDKHLEQPGAALSTYELLEHGWPDAQLTPDSGSNRVYTSISRLRSLGLDDLLMTDDRGYFLDPDLTIARPAH